jgi:DNA-binding NarL/FixJ family response regulator
MLFRKRIVLIDRDENFLGILRYVVAPIDKIIIVNQYTECADALKNIERDQPDIIMMDVDSEILSGPDFIVKVKRKFPRIDVLVISEYTDDATVLNTIGSGAAGFLLKQNCLPHLPESINSLMQGGSPLDPFIARVIINAHHTGESTPLSNQETAVLKLMMKGLTYRMIATELGIAKDTSKTHIRNIYKKLEVNTRAQAVSRAISDKLVPLSVASKVTCFFYAVMGMAAEDVMCLSLMTGV